METTHKNLIYRYNLVAQLNPRVKPFHQIRAYDLMRLQRDCSRLNLDCQAFLDWLEESERLSQSNRNSRRLCIIL